MEMKHRDQSLRILGQKITKIRESRGLTLEKLAYETEISKGNLSEIENGKKNPTYLTLKKISEGLDLTLSQLLRFL